jgi:hypothetical protein
MNHIKPSAAPDCWSKKYQDGDEECMQCRFKDECRVEMLYQVTSKPAQPPVRSYAPPPISPPRLAFPLAFPPAPQTTAAAKPIPQWTVPAVPTFPASSPYIPAQPPKPNIVTTPVQVAQPQPTYFHQTTGSSAPHPSAMPNPMTPWQRPGVVSQSYYFTQYPGEGIGTRIIKNVILRALEAVFAELMQFFRHWTWPPSKK